MKNSSIWSYDQRKDNCRLFILAAVVVAVLSLQAFSKAYRPQGNDFKCYLQAAESINNKTNPYDSIKYFPYIYPLTTAYFMIPLTKLDYSLAFAFWLCLNYFCFIYSIVLLYRMNQSRIGADVLHLVIVIMAVVEIIQNNILNGQINFIVLFLIIKAWDLYRMEHRSRGMVCLAFAASVKLLPVIIVWHFIVRKRFRDVSVFTVALGFFLFLPALIIGTDILSYYHSYLAKFLIKKVGCMSTAFFGTPFSLSGILSSYLPLPDYEFVLKVFSVLIIVTLLFMLSRKDSNFSLDTLLIYLMSMLLINPVSETHHLALYIPAVIIIMFRLKDKPKPIYIFFYILQFLLLYFGRGLDSGIAIFSSLLITTTLLLKLKKE